MSVVTTLSPTRAVLAQFDGGAASVAEIARRTGLDSGVVSLAVERLVASGHLSAERVQSGCPDGGCQACPSGRGGRPGCAAGAPGATAGTVFLTLTVSRRG